METPDRETLKRAFAESLTAEVARRFGTDRAKALRSSIDETADQLADVALFPVDQEEGPAFYMDRGREKRR